MQAINSSQLNDRLVYALKERPSSVVISTTKQDGRFSAGYFYHEAGKQVKLWVSAVTPGKALNSLSRKVHGTFHPREEKQDGEWSKED